MQEQIFIRVLDKASSFIQHEDIIRLRRIMDEEFFGFTVTTECRELVPTSNIEGRIRLFLATLKLEGKAPGTLKNYASILSKFFMAIQKDVEQVNSMDIRMFMSIKANEGLKDNTLNGLLTAIKSFFAWLTNEEYISKNPAMKIKTIKVEKKVRDALTREELEMLRDACQTLRETAILEFFYSTGCRLDEVQQLNLSKINWNNRSMVVMGKGRKERIVYLNERAFYHLNKYLQSRNDDTDAVFVSERKPHARLGRRAIEKVFSNMGKIARIKKPVFPHLLRHTTATNMVQGGATLQDVQRYLGHHNLNTTQVYVDMCQDAVQASHKKCLAG